MVPVFKNIGERSIDKNYRPASLLSAFPPKTNLNLHNVSATPKMVKKTIMNLD